MIEGARSRTFLPNVVPNEGRGGFGTVSAVRRYQNRQYKTLTSHCLERGPCTILLTRRRVVLTTTSRYRPSVVGGNGMFSTLITIFHLFSPRGFGSKPTRNCITPKPSSSSLDIPQYPLHSTFPITATATPFAI